VEAKNLFKESEEHFYNKEEHILAQQYEIEAFEPHTNL